jgi:hypothetical protein
MRIIKFAFLFLIATLFLCGCECYLSVVPLSESPSTKVDAKLLGSWVSIPNDYKEKGSILLLQIFNANEYLVLWKEDGDEGLAMARGFSTKINTTNIMNVQLFESLEINKRKYVFIKYDFNEKGNLVVNVLSNKYQGLKGKEFKSSKDFNDFIQENISQKGLFDKSIEFKAVKEIELSISHKIIP